MRPLDLTLTNYRAFSEGSLPLGSISAAAIVGPNGAGKSSLCEALIWAIYGEGRSSGVDGVVRLGAGEASVQLDYEHAGNVYRIIRKRSRGKRSDLQYLIADGGDWRPISGATIRETQERIVRDLAMDEALFLNSSCVLQGRSAGICEATPAERKAVLYRILEDRLAKFGPLHEAAKATVKGLDDVATVGRARIADLEAVLATRAVVLEEKDNTEVCLVKGRQELEEKEARLAECRRLQAEDESRRSKIADLTARRRALAAEIADLAQQAQRHSVAIGEAEVLLERADEIHAQCEELRRVELELERSSEIREKHRDLKQRYLQLKAELDAEGERLGSQEAQQERVIVQTTESIADRDRVAGLISEVPCQATPMAAECKLLEDARNAAVDAQRLRKRLKDEQKQAAAISDSIKAHTARYAAELDPLHAEGKALGFDQESHSALERTVAQLRPSRDLLPQIEAATARLEAAVAAKESAEAAADGRQQDQAAIDVEIERLSQEAPTATGNIEELEHKRQVCATWVEQWTRSLGVCEERIARLDQAQADLEQITAAMAGQDQQRTLYATLQQAFSRDGIPALIIDAAVPHIEDHANEILARLSDGRMTVRFVTQRAKVSGGIAETLDIIVSDEQGERPYEDWSGGEKLRIDLAVRIALGQVLAQRTGAPVELLILDEVCAPLDEAGEEALVDCINRLRESFACILLITHRESLKDRLPQQIVVTKNGAGSEASLVA